MMLSKFTLDDVCESLAAIPANIAVFSVEPDDQFVIMKMSPMLEALYGVERDSAIGTAVDEFDFDEALRHRLKSTYTRCRDSGLPVTTEDEIPTADGPVWTSRTVTPLLNADGEVVALVSTVFDITELVLKRRTLLRSLSTTASGFVTLCAWCRKVEEDGQWTPLDQYVQSHPESDLVTCPDCQAASR